MFYRKTLIGMDLQKRKIGKFKMGEILTCKKFGFGGKLQRAFPVRKVAL